LEKEVLVTQLTHLAVVNGSPESWPWNPETRTFFSREISFAGKFWPRKLKIAKKFGLKSEKSKKFRLKVCTPGFFRSPQERLLIRSTVDNVSFWQIFSVVDLRNGPQKPLVGRSPPQMTISSIPKTRPTEARYFAGFCGHKIAAFLKISD